MSKTNVRNYVVPLSVLCHPFDVCTEKLRFSRFPFRGCDYVILPWPDILTGFVARAERKVAQGCRPICISVHKCFLVPVNGPGAICLPSKQAEIELEVGSFDIEN